MAATILKLGIVLMNLVYTFMKLLPAQNRVVMISRQSDTPSEEFRMVKEELERLDPEVEVVLLCRTLDGGVNSTLMTKIGYFFHMFTQMYYLSTSRAVILDGYCMTVSILKHKKTLKVVQMWHSMGTMKKFGYSTLDTAEGSSSAIAHAMRMHRNYDYIFASAEAYKEHLAAGFDCDIHKILTMPLPRLDLLNSADYRDKTRGRIYAAYPQLKDKPTILYCPTFRKDETDFAPALQRLIQSIDHKRFNLVVKLHPLSKTRPSGDAILAHEFSSFEMLFAADYVISDYSCIVYEAAVLGIPLYYYNFDMALYTEGRGLAIDYEKELTGVISGDPAVIAAAIERGDYDRAALKAFAEKYVHPTDHATRDIAAFVLKVMGRTVEEVRK